MPELPEARTIATCLACGRTLTRITLGGRTTVYCPKCQA